MASWITDDKPSSGGGGGGVTDHGALTGLAGDDHSQYALADGSRGDFANLVSGKVPAAQLPAYVDDVLEFANLAAFPVTGETGKIYLDLDTNLEYRWSGSVYVHLNPSLALGETSSTGYRGDRGKTAYDHSQDVTTNPHSVTKTQVGLGSVTNDAQLKASDLDTDATGAADSDTRVMSQKAVRSYVAANAASVDPYVALAARRNLY